MTAPAPHAGRFGSRRRAVLHGLLAAGLLFNATLLALWLPNLFIWIDAVAWRSLDVTSPYSAAHGTIDAIGAFLYPPPAVFAFAPLAWLPWPAFATLFLGLNLAAVVLLARRWSILALVAFPPVLLELLNGNIHLLMAAAIWLGFRYPAAWAFVLLTKVTPGVGVLWFAARREWRSLLIAIGVTAAICAVSFVVAPRLWEQWLALVLGAQPVPSIVPPLTLRLPLAAIVVVLAARTDRAWLVPVAAVLAMPTVWLQSSAILLASFPLHWERDRWRRDRQPATTGESAAARPGIVRATEAEGRA